MNKDKPTATKPKQLWEDVYLQEQQHLNPEDESSSSYFFQGPSDRSSQYVPGRGFARYYPALRDVVLVRKKKKNQNNVGVEESGAWSFFTYSWLTKYMIKAFKKGLDVEDVPDPSPQDTCEFNVQRIENLWQEELIKEGPQSASLKVVTWRFVKTRVIFSISILCLCLVLGFINVAYFMRYLLEFAEDFEASKWSGLKWVFLITISEMLRLLLYSIVWAMNVRTGIRLRTAFQGMLYRKILRVHSLGGKSIGELINLFSNDGQRIFDLIILAPMVMAGPLCMILGMTYVYTILGPWPVLGLCTMILFYPLQYLLSYLSGYLKRKVFSITDERITVISEVLNGIKFIKLYAWTKIYISKISEIRKRELGLLTKISYCNSFALALASNAPVMSAIITCVIHIIVEGNITASQAFPIMSFLFTTMRLYILYLQWGLTNIVEISIICKRFKEVMLLNESTIPLSRPLDKSQAVCIADGCFARYLNIDQLKLLKLHKRRKTLTLRRATVTAEEIEKDLLNQPPPTSNYAEILFDINFFAPKGSLIGICGPVGSGKTTLLSGILGHLCMTKGKLCREGTCAYVSQQPWLINATVRENVLFGEKFFARKYYNAIHSCDLEKDIDSLPGGDNTEVGERGVNLSGGQKQRIALARAVYSDRQIYLLDDPLSAVDAQVAIRIFEECVLKILYAKTVLLVSNQMQFLNHCNEIVVMKEGRIIERGNPHDLLARDSEYKIMMEVFTARNEELENITLCNNETKSMNVAGEAVQNHVSNSGNRSSRKGLDGVLIREEKTLHGKLRSNTFFSYVHACGGFVMFFLLLLVMFLNVGSSAFSSWWLHIWIDTGSGTSSISSKEIDNFTITESTTVSYETSAFTTDGNFETTTDYLNESSTFIDQLNTTEPTSVINASNIVLQNLNNTKISGIMDNPHYSYYLTVYCCSIAAIFLTNLLRGLVFTKVTLRASSFIHKKLVERLMKTYMLFFETTPVGRVQNLFSKDIDEVETRLPYTLEGLIQGIWNIAFSTLFVCLAYPIFIGPVIVVCILYAFVDRIFRAGLRDLKRLDNTTRSPILSNVSVTVQGLDSIHAFEKEKSFVSRFNASYDLNTTCSYMCNIAQRWLALRVDGLAVLILLVTSLLVVFMHGSVSASLAGLALTYATTFAGLLQYTIRLFSDNEVKMISVERINSYHQYMEEEGGTGPKGVPKETWPELGSIRFKNVELKYREELDPSLKGVSFHVRSEEKIGIIGRTGAGKSSIISALFRLVEISKGVITIDNLDIAGLELTELRKRMSVIPQDPVLLSGTVRFNLDPKNEHLDEALWAVLEKTGLKPRISQSEEKLNMKLSFNDDSLSTGEKQLLCIARALLKNTKVLVLDEATSSLDHEIEATIRKIIFDEMKHCTTIIIAHRLDTIKGCNRVLVMEDGKVLEYDEPATLLQNSESMFYKMVNATFHGDRSYQ